MNLHLEHGSNMRELLSAALAVIVALSLATACAPLPQTGSLVVRILYPAATHTVAMGQSIKSIVKVLDQDGKPVREARVSLSVVDPTGTVLASLPATLGAADLYRTDSWVIPHKQEAGLWTIQAQVEAGSRHATSSTTFRVKNSVSEDLLARYGFWIDAPALGGITPFVAKEQGDAQNGILIWGGQRPMAHVFAESWLEVQWRAADFKLSTPDEVRAFMLNKLGDLGFSPVRALGPFEPTKFKTWDAWLVKARGQLSRYDEQWMIFYAPEAGKTYALGTTVVLPPKGIEPHDVLRSSFEVHPELYAAGQAPVPFTPLLPPPELVSPDLGTRIIGTDQPIILKWKPLKDLAPDEYYQVTVDYNYDEANPGVDYFTRTTEITLPELLYNTPNCGVFNWQVRLVRQTGIGADGRPDYEPLSYSSLYWYLEWFHPLEAPAPFDPLCPNQQI